MAKNTGITMVSLAVTIIVLIILAGVSLNMTIGDNGIITQAQKARENIELSRVKEEEQLNILYEQLESGNGVIFPEDTQLAELQNKYNKLQEEYNKLQEDYNNLQTENGNLQEENDNLQIANSNLQTENSNLQTINSNLQTEYNNFKMQVAIAITNKGVATSGTDSNETIINNISKIAGGTIETMTVRIGNANTTNSTPAQPGWTFVGAYATGVEVKNSNGHMTYCGFYFSYDGYNAGVGVASGAIDGANTYTRTGDMYAIYARVVS